MNTKTEKLKELLSNDRRKDERLSLPVVIFYSIPPDNDWEGPLSVYDIGGGGVKVKSVKRIRKDSEVKLKIEIPDDPDLIIVAGEVIWCKKSSDSGTDVETYNIGIKFSKMNYDDRRRFINYISDKIITKYLTGDGEIIL